MAWTHLMNLHSVPKRPLLLLPQAPYPALPPQAGHFNSFFPDVQMLQEVCSPFTALKEGLPWEQCPVGHETRVP